MIKLSNITAVTVRTQAKTFPLTAVIDTALCVGAGGSTGSLADKPILRNGKGQLVIPASQVKGRLRHECEKLVSAIGWPICESPKATRMCPQLEGRTEDERNQFRRASYQLSPKLGETAFEGTENQYQHCLICQIFGNPVLPARLQLSDLVCAISADELEEVLRPGVSINRRRRTAEDQRLYFVETSPANAKLRFEGSLRLQPKWDDRRDIQENSSQESSDLVQADVAEAIVLAGLKHIHALGGGKSAGLGWLHWEVEGLGEAISDDVWRYLGGGKGGSNAAN